MNSMRVITGLLGLSGLLGGCANPINRSFVPSGPTVAVSAMASADCVIRETKDLAQEASSLRARGWKEIGKSSYTDSGSLNLIHAEAQARKVGAALVLWQGWSYEERLDEVTAETSGRSNAAEVPGQPGASPNPARQVFSPPPRPYKVTVYRYEIVFWRKPAG